MLSEVGADQFIVDSITTINGVTVLVNQTRLSFAVLLLLGYAATSVVMTWVATLSVWLKNCSCSGGNPRDVAGGKVLI